MLYTKQLLNGCQLLLTWEQNIQQIFFIPHTEKIISTSNQKYGFIPTVGHGLSNKQTLKVLFDEYVRSSFKYACIIWNPYCQTHVNAIEGIQIGVFQTRKRISTQWYCASGITIYKSYNVKTLREYQSTLFSVQNFKKHYS